jgi:hypothetical protein
MMTRIYKYIVCILLFNTPISTIAAENNPALANDPDQPLRNLMISLKNNNETLNIEDNSEFSGGIRQGTIYIGTGKPVAPKQEGLNLRSNNLGYSTHTTTRTTRTQAEYQIRVIENHPAYIYTGETRQLATERYGNSESTRVDANKGFYVSAHLAGDRVLLDIFVVNAEFGQPVSDLDHSTMSTQRLSTSVSGQVGEWIPLGGLVLSDNGSETPQAKKITTHSQSLGDISIKINLLPQ